MPNIRRQAPRPHVVIPDTSVLWHEDKSHPVDPKFDDFWNQHTSLVTLHLAVPDIVRSELVFQQTTSARKACDKMFEHLAMISRITARPQRHRVQNDKLRVQVETKIDRWIHDKQATLLPIPVSQIDWAGLCEAAAWRLPPFTYDPKNVETEKGFRDTLVMETVIQYASTCTDDVNIVFVCADRLLRETVADRLQSDARCSCYETLQDFSSYINLTREQLTNQFIKAILRRARQRFFRPGDPNCFFFRVELNKKVIEALAPVFENPTSANDTASTSWERLLSPPLWKGVGQYKNFIAGPVFQRVVNDTDYYWTTRVTRSREFYDSRSTPPATPARILQASVNVNWHAHVTADGRFRQMTFDSLDLGEASFRTPTDEDVKDFRPQMVQIPATQSPEQ